MHSYLQTKAVSLALEAKYIRKQERRFAAAARHARVFNKTRSAAWHERNRFGQYHHRVTVVRNEARVTNLARGFLRGHPYYRIERIAYSEPNWNRVKELVLAYGEGDNPRYNRPLEELFSEWKLDGIRYYVEAEDARYAYGHED